MPSLGPLLLLAALACARGRADASEEEATATAPEGYYDTQEWRAVGPFTASLPAAAEDSYEPPPRRRRGRRRKGRGRRRKQRPYLPVLDTNSELGPSLSHDINSGLLGPLSGETPQDLPKESSGSAPPDPPGEAREEEPKRDKSYRRAYSRTKKQENPNQVSLGGSSDLKTLLKQSGGTSLSELLQGRNLSLADLLAGERRALSALGTRPEEDGETSRRLPPAIKSPKDERGTIAGDETSDKVPSRMEDADRRRLPTIVFRKSRPSPELPAMPTSQPRKHLSDNIIRRRTGDLAEAGASPAASGEKSPVGEERSDEKPAVVGEKPAGAEAQAVSKNIIEDDDDITPTTSAAVTIQKENKPIDSRDRLSLKPRLRLPAVKHAPRRILKPFIALEPLQNTSESRRKIAKSRKSPIPAQAIPINVKDLFGMSDIISASKIIAKDVTESSVAGRNSSEGEGEGAVTERSTAAPAAGTPGPSAKEEILEVLTDLRGGERLTRILAERNMSLGELVAQRERGSSQLHLADIFSNSSRNPSVPEPFLSKSMIAPISREIYPLKALLEGNMAAPAVPMPPTFPDRIPRQEDDLGIVTLFDQFSEFGGIPKVLDPQEMKKDSDGSSYFTSVINVRPTDEVYREPRDGGTSHKRVSQIYSSLPTYLNMEEMDIDARVVPDWSAQLLGGEEAGLIVLSSSASLPAASPGDGDGDGEGGEGLYGRLPVAVRSAIMVSSCVAGSSLLVFLTILVACRLRQRRRSLHSLHASLHSSLPPSLPSAGGGEPRYLWDSLRKPFQ